MPLHANDDDDGGEEEEEQEIAEEVKVASKFSHNFIGHTTHL